MVAIVLTPKKAFRAIQELQNQRKRISGRLVWQQCGEIGSISTAVKWVKVAKAIAQGDEPVDQELVEQWEAIAQGKDVTHSESTPSSLPPTLQDMFERFSQKVAIAIQEAIAEGVLETQKTAAGEIEVAESEVIKTQERSHTLEQEIHRRKTIIEQHCQTIAELREEAIRLNTRHDQLAQQLNQSNSQKVELASTNRELSEQVGILSQNATHLAKTLDEKQDEINDRLNELNQVKETNRADTANLRELEQSNAILEARLKANQNELEREQQNRHLSEKRCDELRTALIRTTAEAATAVERAKHFEARISELKNELKQKA